MHEPAVRVFPSFDGAARVYLHGYVLETLLVAALCHLVHNLTLVYVLLQRQQNLHWIDGFDEVVGNL